MKKVRVNEKYGTWTYKKEIDLEDSTNYMYYFSGTDANGRKWSWSTPYYNEMIDFIKADDKTKQIFINYY